MGSLAPQVARLPPQLRVHAADGRSFRYGHGHRLQRTSRSRERLGGVTALYAATKSRLLQDVTVCKHTRLFDKDAQAVSKSDQLDSVRKEDQFFEVEMTVRDDDIDEYGVVNNAIYACYIHRGRDMMLQKIGMRVDDLAATGKAMALSELNLKYFAPLRGGDRFVVKIKPVQIKGARIIVHHVIERLPDRELVLEAKGTVVFLNQDYRPTRVFPEVSAKTWKMFPCMEG